MGGSERAHEKSYDLEERTARFGESVIAFVRAVPKDEVTRPIVSQVIRAATSIGANYCEADDSVSKKDFRHKIALCRKESKEVKHWLRMMAAAAPQLKDDARRLWGEARELNLIFGSIVRGTSKD
jgi:four helix bundle protein